MKDNRFIELLNLYIDRQITAEETAELEAEIQQNPKRQAVYRQYCQIHAATKLVYDSFRAGAAEQPAVPSGRPATVELFESRSRRTQRWAYYAGGLAAAACAAFVLMRHPAQPVQLAATKAAPVTVAAAPVAAPVQPAVTQVTPSVPATTTAPNLISLRNTTATPDYSAMLVALREQDEERAHAGDRWQSGKVQSLFDDNLFDVKPAMVTPPEQRTLRRQTQQQQAEFTAFQFQR